MLGPNKTLFATILLLASTNPLYAATALNWQRQALKLTGESDKIRASALKNLADISNLDEQLEKALAKGTNREQALALDTITALKLTKFAPQLRKLLARDQTGQMHLTLAMILDPDERQATQVAFLQELEKQRSTPAAQIAQLSVFSRWRLLIPVTVLRSLLNSESFEVRFAALSYIRAALLDGAESKYLPLVEQGLKGQPYQLRLRSLFLVYELPKRMRVKFITPLTGCSAEPHLAVKGLCNLVSESVRTNSTLTAAELLKASVANSPSEPSADSTTVTAGVFFGYKDARPANFVSDLYETAFISDSFIKPCTKKEQTACGFTRSHEDAELFVKNFAGSKKILELHLVASSFEDNDDRNRKNPFQKWLSEHAQMEFQNSLLQHQSVLYNGHSRDGGRTRLRAASAYRQRTTR
jgi:hypothetical protein